MMQNKLISIIIGVVLVLGVGSLVYFKKTSPTAIKELPDSITLAQVAVHSSRTSCWSAVNGSVYDLTSWIPNHPGGEEAILWMCGID